MVLWEWKRELWKVILRWRIAMRIFFNSIFSYSHESMVRKLRARNIFCTKDMDSRVRRSLIQLFRFCYICNVLPICTLLREFHCNKLVSNCILILQEYGILPSVQERKTHQWLNVNWKLINSASGGVKCIQHKMKSTLNYVQLPSLAFNFASGEEHWTC